MKNLLDEVKIKNHLLICWSLESSSLWTKENPACGQCGVTALIIHANYGGEILKTKFSNGSWHYYNSIEGKIYDFTKDQFLNKIEYHNIPSSRDEAFTDTTEDQYNYLLTAFNKIFI